MSSGSIAPFGKTTSFDEPDDLRRVARAIEAVEQIEDPVVAAGVPAYRVTWTQGFGEGNKRTALLVARWVLDQNGLDGAAFLPPDDRQFADLLVKAASGADVEAEIVALLLQRRQGSWAGFERSSGRWA